MTIRRWKCFWYCLAAMATLLKKQKPSACEFSAWCPGGRTKPNPLRSEPDPTEKLLIFSIMRRSGSSEKERK
jgi:hypothetical protein